MSHLRERLAASLAILATVVLLTGCVSIYENTHAYLGSPAFAAVDPEIVQILESEPKTQKVRLGEIILGVQGKPTRADIEKKIKVAAAKLGADGVFIAYDRTHIFPVVYTDYWWGPTWVTQDSTRNIVAIAFKYK